MDDSFFLPSGFAFPKNSQFIRMFNFYLSKLEETGFAKKLYSKWIHRSPPPKQKNENENELVEGASAIAFDNLILPVWILVGGIVLSGVIALIEPVLGRVRKVRQKSDKF